jgi:hypothetical protein
MTREELNEGIRSVHTESGGLIRISIVGQADVPDLALAAVAGDTTAIGLLAAVSSSFERFHAAPSDGRFLCASCSGSIEDGRFSFAFAMPAKASPQACLALAICAKCADAPETAEKKAITVLREVWPDLRSIPPASTAGGHA